MVDPRSAFENVSNVIFGIETHPAPLHHNSVSLKTAKKKATSTQNWAQAPFIAGKVHPKVKLRYFLTADIDGV